MGFLNDVVDVLAKSGLIFRGDPPKVVDLRDREWGVAVGGLTLSVLQRKTVLSVVLRNIGATPRTIVHPSWLHFLQVEISSPPLSEVPLSAFGRQSLKPLEGAARVTTTIAADGPVEVDVPVGLLFNLEPGVEYCLRVSCAVDGADGTEKLVSNECVWR